jgi:hypothetical protein
MATRAAPMVTVPAGTPTAQCRSCHLPIYWVKSEKSGKSVPVSCNGEGHVAPSASHDGFGVNHFVDCETRDQHRRPR